MIGAVGFLTVLGGSRVPSSKDVVWFPVVGALVGAVIGGAWWGAGELWPPVVAAAIVVALDLALTGMLHLDGLADAADGLLPHLDRARRLAVMREPSVGAFGVGVVAVVLGLRVAAFASMAPDVLMVAGLWCAARTVMAVGLRAVPYARASGGLATAFGSGSPAPVAAVGVVSAVGLAAVGEGAPGVAGVVGALLAGAGVVALGRYRLGGYTGDVLGAAGMLAETVGLVVAARELVNRSLEVAVGLGLDRIVGEPADAWHPVAWFGTAMGAVERRVYRPERVAGVAYAAAGVGLGLAAGRVVDSTALATAAAVAGRGLTQAATSIGDALAAGDLDLARERLPALVGRDPNALDEQEIARAVVESVAENTVDAVVAPACWAIVAGAPGVLAHRAVNTMDAMVGHRNPRYADFGTAAARLDDLAAWVPARLTALLVAAARPSSAGQVLRIVRRDAAGHPSPNAGVAESAFAAALGVQLGGMNRYGDRVESRPTMGDGRPVRTGDIARAVRLSGDCTVVLGAGLGLLGAAVALRRRTAAG